jgi:hypothetical protein
MYKLAFIIKEKVLKYDISADKGNIQSLQERASAIISVLSRMY